MPTATTTLSTKGQLVLPKALRDLKQWHSGTKLELLDVPGGILVTREPARQVRNVDDVFGMLKFAALQLSEAEIELRIDESIAEEIRVGKW